MFWLPGQSRSSWAETVEQAVGLSPDHLSLYLLELYPNAPLKEAMARAAEQREVGRTSAPTAEALEWAQAADDDAADMYLDALERLDTAGYVQYEISNVARPGRASRHNLKYWQGGAWRGFGCGAHSTVDGLRWKNTSATLAYIEGMARGGGTVRTDVETLTRRGRLEEALFTGLRLSAGIDRGTFLAQYGVDPWERHRSDLEPLLDAAFLWSEGTRFGLTRRGMLVANEILATFVSVPGVRNSG